MVTYGITRELPNVGYDEAVTRVTEALKTEGFGVITEIDVKKTIKEKLGIDVRRYRILGACNPPIAHAALEADPMIGLLLPCNVIVFEGERVVDSRGTVAEITPVYQTVLDAINELVRLPGIKELAADEKRYAKTRVGVVLVGEVFRFIRFQTDDVLPSMFRARFVYIQRSFLRADLNDDGPIFGSQFRHGGVSSL